METILQDVRFAARTLRQQPVFTLIAVLSLALGVGANAAVFTFVDAYVLRALPYEAPDELLHLWAQTRRGTSRVSLPDFVDWRAQSSTFVDMAAFNYTIETLTGGDLPEELSGGRISANVFGVLGVTPVRGRDFMEGEDRVGADPVALLAEPFWNDRYGRDPGAIGESIEIDGIAHTIVGVMPAGVNFPLPTTDLWLPRQIDDPSFRRGRGLVQVVGRLAPGASVEQAREEMDAIASRLQGEYPATNEDIGVTIEPLRQALNFAWEVIQPMSVVLTAAVAFVLLIGCANVASLMLARATTRERELAVRAALGARRSRLIRLMLTESALIALLGGVVGLLFAALQLRLLATTLPADLYRTRPLELDATVIAFALLLALGTAFLFGLVPALRSARPELAGSLRSGSGGSGLGRRKVGLQGAMVTVEVTLAVVLLIGTVLMLRTVGNLQAVDPGFAREGVLTGRMMLESSLYEDAESVARFHQRVVEELEAVPGVVAASTVDYLPLNHETNVTEFAVADQDPSSEPWQAIALSVGPGYLDVMRIPLLAGRDLSGADDAGSDPVAMVDATLVERFLGGVDPVGAELRLGDGTPVRVVGVVGASHQVELARSPDPVIYLSQQQVPRRYMRILVRTAVDPVTVAPAARAAVAELEPRLPLSEVRTLGQVVDDFLLAQSTLADGLAMLAAGALLLAAIGVYGLMAFFVSQRVRDIGIHVALGATRGRVAGMIGVRILRLTAIGVGIGLAIAYATMRLLGSFLYGVEAADPLAFGAAAALLAAIALGAGLVGARRALTVDPMTVLREG